MNERLTALRDLLENPSSNPAALGAGLAIVVVIVVVVALILIVLALPSRPREDYETPGSEEEPGSALPPKRERTPSWVGAFAAWVLGVTALVLSVVVFYESTSPNTYCTRTCHAMAEPAATHAASAHEEIDCIRCHEGRKWETLWGGLASRGYSIYLQYSGARPKVTEISDNRCLECHTAAMSIELTARNGESFRHRELPRSGRGCERCHGAQGHELPVPR